MDVRGFVCTTALIAACGTGSAFAQTQNLFVSDGEGSRVVRYEYGTGLPIDHFVAKGISPLDGARYMRITPDGDLAVCSRNTNSVELYDGQTGQYMHALVPDGAGGLDGPKDVVFDDDGNIYVSSIDNNQVIKYQPNGAFDKVLIDQGLAHPAGMAFGPDGNLYVCSRDNGKVRYYDPESGENLQLVDLTSAGVVAPAGVVFDEAGNLYVADYASDTIAKKPPFGAATIFVASGAGGLDGPTQIAFGPLGHLLVASDNSDEVLLYDGVTGDFRRVVMSMANSGNLKDVYGIALQPGQTACDVVDLNNDGRVNFDDLDAFIDGYMQAGDCNQ